jgi:hypothetical protein
MCDADSDCQSRCFESKSELQKSCQLEVQLELEAAPSQSESQLDSELRLPSHSTGSNRAHHDTSLALTGQQRIIIIIMTRMMMSESFKLYKSRCEVQPELEVAESWPEL